MKTRISLMIFLISGVFLGLFLYNKFRVAPKMEFYNLELFDSSGIKVDMNKFKGKKIIVSYYASWCGDCLRELKSLNEVKELKLKDVEIVAITDETTEKLISFQKRKNYPFHFYRINKSFSEIKVFSIPVNYMINSQGKTYWEKVGTIDWNDNDYIQLVRKLD